MKIFLVALLGFILVSDAFTPQAVLNSCNTASRDRVRLQAEKKKRRRKRKQSPSEGQLPSDDPGMDDVATTGADRGETLSEEELAQIQEIANYRFDPNAPISFEPLDSGATQDTSGNEFVLPDINDILKKRESEREMPVSGAAGIDVKKVKRSDKEAYQKLLEQSPFADADESLFEEEEYNVVSAILGERAKPFLGIPTGPLQVGHFVGALGIVLMAFIEYPGFPLTNLPTPIRDALQGGLASIYAINTVLAIQAVFKASERGQPIPLWVAKTFSVGGLALDQLTQLPTLEEKAMKK